MNSTKEYVDSLFSGYEQTDALADFTEELRSNLDDKISNLLKKGMDAQAAFDKATTELGDISALADEISLKKRQEVFEDAYMDIKQYMKPPRVVGYVAFGVTLLFGIIVALIVYFTDGNYLPMEDFLGTAEHLTGVFASFMPFFVAAVAGFTFLGLTQELADSYPVSKKRAVWYAAAAAVLAFGISIFPVVYFAEEAGLMPAIATLIPFVLPGGGLLAFLVLTEKSRLKPWAQARYAETIKREHELWRDPATADRFGMFSGAIWIFAFAVFMTLGFLIGFKYSWLAFVFATAIQCVVQGAMMGKKKN
ncbi:MAG: permease prefix domain 1-containing protein [Treponema sp.]|jgi:hypothetical protein|nr:permease prefix domain 1-containing protein [Treponema sp.]